MIEARGQPKVTFRADKIAVAPTLNEKVVQPFWMKGPASLIDEAAGAVFFGLRHMFAAQFYEPAGRAC